MGILSYIIVEKTSLHLSIEKKKRRDDLGTYKRIRSKSYLIDSDPYSFRFLFLIPLLVFLSTDIDDNSNSESTKITNTLINYRGAAMYYRVDNDDWPSVGEYLPDSPMVGSLDHYTEKSFDKENYSQLLIKEIPAGSKRLYLGLRPGKGSALSFNKLTRKNLAKRSTVFRADGLPYSSDIIGSGDVFIPMKD